MKLSNLSRSIILRLPGYSVCSVEIGQAFGLETERYPNRLSSSWLENGSVTIVLNLATTPDELLNLLQRRGHKVVNSVRVTGKEFLSALNKCGYKIGWRTKEEFWVKSVDFADARHGVTHRQT